MKTNRVIKRIGYVLLFLIAFYLMPITHLPSRWIYQQVFLNGAEFAISPGKSITLRERSIGYTLNSQPFITAPDFTSVEVIIINPGAYPRPRAEFHYRVTVNPEAPDGVYELKIQWPNYQHIEKFLVAPLNIFHSIYSILFLSARTVDNGR